MNLIKSYFNRAKIFYKFFSLKFKSEDLNTVDHNQLEPQLLGECLAHSGAVQVFICCLLFADLRI